jgi:hypothetical protein
VRLVRAMISKDDLQGGKVPEWERLKERLGSGITTVFAISVEPCRARPVCRYANLFGIRNPLTDHVRMIVSPTIWHDKKQF